MYIVAIENEAFLLLSSLWKIRGAREKAPGNHFLKQELDVTIDRMNTSFSYRIWLHPREKSGNISLKKVEKLVQLCTYSSRFFVSSSPTNKQKQQKQNKAKTNNTQKRVCQVAFSILTKLKQLSFFEENVLKIQGTLFGLFGLLGDFKPDLREVGKLPSVLGWCWKMLGEKITWCFGSTWAALFLLITYWIHIRGINGRIIFLEKLMWFETKLMYGEDARMIVMIWRLWR